MFQSELLTRNIHWEMSILVICKNLSILVAQGRRGAGGDLARLRETLRVVLSADFLTILASVTK